MHTAGDTRRLTLDDPMLRRLFVKKEVGAAKRDKTAAGRSDRSIFPYGDAYTKVQSYYRFVE